MFSSDDVGDYLPSLLDAEAAPDSLAEWARTVTPGSAVVKPLTHLRPAQLSTAGRVDAVAALEVQIAWLQALQLAMIASVATDYPSSGDGRRFVTEEISCALRLSPASADDRVALAESLTHRLPNTWAALERGDITVGHARYLVEQTRELEPERRTAVEQRVLSRAAGQSHSEFRRAVRRVVAEQDTRAAEQRHEVARAHRTVAVFAAPDGMADLYARLTATDAQHLFDRLTALATDTCAHDTRTLDQRRADALIDLADRLPADAPRERKPAVQVTVALSTLLGVDDQPGELAGYGPVPATLAREIAADDSGTWRRLVTDERGRLLDAGRATYRPPASMQRFVRARDRTCRFPHCHRPASRSDLDHIIEWNRGGETNSANLHALCKRHHHAKHDGGWTIRRNADGSTGWRSPLGLTYAKAAATYPANDHDPPPF